MLVVEEGEQSWESRSEDERFRGRRDVGVLVGSWTDARNGELAGTMCSNISSQEWLLEGMKGVNNTALLQKLAELETQATIIVALTKVA